MNSVLGDCWSFQLQNKFEAVGERNKIKIYLKQSDFQEASPAQIWTIVDTHPDTLADYAPNSAFLLAYSQGESVWNSLPASYHNGGCTFAFADGHTEFKKWILPETRQAVTFRSFIDGARPKVAAGRRDDYRWFWLHTAERLKDFPPIE